MMSPAVIRQEADKAARYARHNGYRPTLVTEENKAALLTDLAAGRHPRLLLHYIGDYVPKGYTPTDTLLFVDTSGFGDRSEPALTVDQFAAALRPGFAYAIVEAGQFQAYVQEFIPPKSLHERRVQAAAIAK